MAEIPQLQDTQPVLNPVTINSKAEGHEAFAKTLGSLAASAEQKTEEIVEEQSNAMALQSMTQMQTAKVNSEIEMIKHPDQSGKIAAGTADVMNSITKNSFVNSKDRRKLQSIAADNFNDVRLKAAHVGYEQSQKSLSIAYWDNYPVVMKSIQDALDKQDFKTATTLENTFHQASLDAAKIGAISPEQFATIRKVNHELYTRTQGLLHMAQNPEDHNAQTFHTVSQSPFSQGNYNNTGYPVNGHTQYVASSYNFDRTMSGQYANLYSDQPLNFGVIAQSTPHEYDEFKQQMMGVFQIKGAVHSGMPFSQIDERINNLSALPKLSPMQEGEVKYWKAFKNNLAHGDGYLNMMTQTTLGGQYTQEYNQTAVAIRDSGKTNEEKATAMRDNDNAYIGHMISLGQSQHVDPSYIHPIPGQWVNETQSSFAKDAPVLPALSRLAYLKPEYRAYLADAMSKPNQAMAVYLAGATLDKADPTFQANLLEANQNRDYSAFLKSGKDETKDVNVWTDISTDPNIKSLLGYLSKLPGGTETLNGFKQTATNYVLYRAAKEADVNLNGKSQYERDFVTNIAKGFDIVEGNRYVFNAASLNLREADMDYIADYALSEAYRSIHQGRSEAEFQSYVDLNPLHAINTPDGRIVVIDKAGNAAVDPDGRAAFDHPYTSDMLAMAHKNSDETQKYMHQYFGVAETLGRQAKLGSGVPFVPTAEEREKAERRMKKSAKEVGKAILNLPGQIANRIATPDVEQQ